ncbi:MAG: AMP-binding protein [Burkholderiaceae bacterium]|nr:AMP-binding protein [Burkholderiaceae bacterium]
MTAGQVGDHHAAMQAGFRWLVPRHFNIAQACSARWAALPGAGERVAVIEHRVGAKPVTYSYAQLQAQANRLSNALARLGVRTGDRVAIVMPQRFETAVAYMAVLQMGAIAMPLSQLFGPEALEYRLQNAAATVAICDEGALANLLAARETCLALQTVIGLGAGAERADHEWHALLARSRERFAAADTLADDAAVLIYTSGTTGPPKGALIPQRALIGNLPGFVCSQNWFGFDAAAPGRASRAVFWSPADWAWTGGLMDALLPTLYFGRPIVAHNGRFDPTEAFEILSRHRVTHAFLFPTALKAMMKAVPHPRPRYALQLQGLMSAGEAVGDALFAYCRKELGVVVNEMFGQTEVNYVVGNCAMNDHRLPGVGWPARPGSMGRGYPGHLVALIDDKGEQVPVGEPGEVAVRRTDVHGHHDPIFFLGYWNNEAATRAKFSGDWWRTGDLAVRDAEGYLWYQGRADDVFKAAGYRIGPGEIENCLVKHPAVLNCAVVPKPDAARGALVKAYVVLSPDFVAARALQAGATAQFELNLIAALQEHVKGKLAPYEYPKEIEFIDQLPTTTTGKVQRRVLRLQEEERARAAGLV